MCDTCEYDEDGVGCTHPEFSPIECMDADCAEDGCGNCPVCPLYEDTEKKPNVIDKTGPVLGVLVRFDNCKDCPNKEAGKSMCSSIRLSTCELCQYDDETCPPICIECPLFKGANQMTAHALAKRLLEMPDEPVFISMDISTGQVDQYNRYFSDAISGVYNNDTTISLLCAKTGDNV